MNHMVVNTTSKHAPMKSNLKMAAFANTCVKAFLLIIAFINNNIIIKLEKMHTALVHVYLRIEVADTMFEVVNAFIRAILREQ